MIITNRTVSSLGKIEQKVDFEGFTFYLKGFVYIDHFAPGADSLREFAKQWKRKSIHQAIQQLRGHFFLLAVDNDANQRHAFIDNSGIFGAYYSDKAISTSFLDLARHEKMSKQDMDKPAILGFLNQGNLYFNRTFFRQIKKIADNEILTFNEDGKISVTEKQLDSLKESSVYNDIYDYFEAFASTIKDRTVSVDLTGGIDSRLVCATLDAFGIPFETSVSGSDDDPDITIAKSVASELKVPLHITKRPSMLDEETLRDLFSYSDGLFDVLKLYSARTAYQERKKRGVDLVIKGTGGELYKDFWWLQDFPFYKKGKSDLGKLVNTRIVPIQIPQSYLTETYQTLNQAFKKELVHDLMTFKEPMNTQTYDQVYYRYSMQHNAGHSTTCGHQYLDNYSPLLEHEAVKIGFQLPRKKRFNNHFHREVMTSLNPAVASIKTTEGGITVSSKFHHKVSDNMKYVVDKGKRLTKKVGQKVVKKTFLADRYHNDHLFTHIKQLGLVQRSIDLLKEENILNPDLQVDEIGNHHLGRMITLALFIEFLDSHETVTKDTWYTSRKKEVQPQ